METPKLRYPINTFKLKTEDRLILLAYDIVYRTKNLEKIDVGLDDNFLDDLDVNLAQLGSHIETEICAGDLSLRFEGYDKQEQEHSAENIFTELNQAIMPVNNSELSDSQNKE